MWETVGFLIGLGVFVSLFTWRFLLPNTLQPDEYGDEFIVYNKRNTMGLMVGLMFLLIATGLVITYDLWSAALVRWGAVTALTMTVVGSRMPQSQNMKAAFLVRYRNQVRIGEDFEITYPNGVTDYATLTRRDGHLSHAKDFNGNRPTIKIPHTQWIDSVVKNLSHEPVRWETEIPLKLNDGSRVPLINAINAYLDNRARFCNVVRREEYEEHGEKKFEWISLYPQFTLPFTYQVKVIPKVFGMVPYHVLQIYTMVTNREYGFDEESLFLDDLYSVISDVEGVTIGG